PRLASTNFQRSKPSLPFLATLNFAALLPLSDHRQGSRLAKGPETCIYSAAVPAGVAIEVEFPQSRARIEDADLGRPRTSPVAGYGEISRDTEGPQAAV